MILQVQSDINHFMQSQFQRYINMEKLNIVNIKIDYEKMKVQFVP